MTDTTPRRLWAPAHPEATEMYKFMQKVNQKHGLSIQDYWELYDYSISHRSQFWSDWFQQANIIHAGSYQQAVDESQPIDAIPKWFRGVSLSFVENILYTREAGAVTDSRGTRHKENGKVAVTEVREGGVDIHDFDWATLRRDTAGLASAFKASGVGKGDRIFVVGSNSYTTLTLFLAASWVGAIFSSTSPDMGTQGILQRAKQIGPKLIFMDDGATYNGQEISLGKKAMEVLKQIRGESWFQNLIIIPKLGKVAELATVPGSESLAKFLSQAQAQPPAIERLPFHAPCLISYSSGTTGEPKCIVHSVGGLVLNTLKENVLHGDLTPDGSVLQFTTTGWIMYVACVVALMPGARTILYDGSPFFPRPTAFVEMLSSQGVTSFGTSPRWMFELLKLGISPRKTADLSKLRTVSSTGMVLSDQLFNWFYDEGFPSHVRLSNMSGGTDIAGCFALGNPISPLYVGGCQGPALGVAISVYDPEGKGHPVASGAAGELVAHKSFPNVPVFFWNDALPSQRTKSRFFSSYFAKYDHVWAHGDFVSVHPATKAILFHGRADGVLNPSGIRFGSSEIYGVIERHFSDLVADSICVGQRRPSDSDETVLLFLQMKPGRRFTQGVITSVKNAIRGDLSNKHVPKHVFEVPEIPVTSTFKKVELPVKHIVSGKVIKPSASIANPRSLDFFYQFAEIETVIRKAKL